MSRKLNISVVNGASLDAALIRDLWKLRLAYLTLSRSEADDLSYFTEFITKEDALVVAFHDHEGRLQGFFSILFLPSEHNGKKGLLMYSKYFYFHKAYRGHYKTIAAPWLLLPVLLRRYGLKRLYFITTAFPQSYIALSRAAGNVHALSDPEATEWEKKAMVDFAQSLFPEDWDSDQQVVKNQNVADSPSVSSSVEGKKLYAKFERLNPTWKQGHSVPVIFAVDTGMVKQVFKSTLKRLING